MPSSLGEWAATKLFGQSEEEKAARAKEFYQVAKENPGLGDLPADQFNSALQQYVKDRSFPTTTVKDVPSPEVRQNFGITHDEPNPSGGVPISVMPQTDVTQKVDQQSFPIQMGPGHDVYTENATTGELAHQPDIPNDAIIKPYNDRSYLLGGQDSRERIAAIQAEERLAAARLRAGAGGGRGGKTMSPQSRINMGTINRMLMASQPRLDTGTGQFITPTVPDELLRAGLAAAKAEGVDLSAYDIPEPTEPTAPTGIWDRVKAAGRALSGDTPSPSAPAGAPTADTSPAPVLPKAGGGQSDAEATAYLKSIGAKMTTANIAWAKKRKGAPGGK